MKQQATPYTQPRFEINPEVARRILDRDARKFAVPVLFVLVHIPLGVLLYQSSVLASIHPWITLVVGLFWAIRKNEPLFKVAMAVGYIAGVEVLWRMAGANILWEFGKYASAVIMIIALVQRHHWKLPSFPLAYLAFLVPSSLLAFYIFGFGVAQETLSFNMSGPFLLLVSCWFFSYLKVTRDRLKKLLFVVSVPILSIAVSTVFYTVSQEDLVFLDDSMSATSGGFGPNQVSSILGLGVFVCFSALLLFKAQIKDLLYLITLGLFFAGSSVITFSRGGIYNAVGALILVLLFQTTSPAKAGKKALLAAGVVLIFLFLLFPFLNDFTGGALETRFSDQGTTGRQEIVKSDFQLFFESPLLGTGVGGSYAAREKFLEHKAVSHTEFSRIIAEHGIFGIFALIALGLGSFLRFWKQDGVFGKSFAIGVIAWSSFFMMNAGMRLAAPAIMWGLCFVTIVAKKIRVKKVGRGLGLPVRLQQ